MKRFDKYLIRRNSLSQKIYRRDNIGVSVVKVEWNNSYSVAKLYFYQQDFNEKDTGKYILSDEIEISNNLNEKQAFEMLKNILEGK